jgi:CheY-like chemotaxis protein
VYSPATVAGYKTQLPPGLFGGEQEDRSFSGLSAPSPRHCVVIIEDNPGDVFIIEEALREHDVQCETTVLSDGEQAASFFDRLDNGAVTDCPRVVLLDLNLPRRSGHWVLRRIRASRRCPAVPVVIVSSSQAPVDLEQNRKLGATTYFKKPSNLEEFMKLGALVNHLMSDSPE